MKLAQPQALDLERGDKIMLSSRTKGIRKDSDKDKKNVAFRDTESQFIPRRKHITSPLRSPAS
jgi:hypothetical protein